jgi:hypothetical protein
MKNAALLVLLGLISVFVADCIVAYPTFGPPPLRQEVMVGRPGPGYIWIGGYWGWSGGRYSWNSGSWTKAKPGKSWVPHRWEQNGRNWVFRRGYWR